MQLAGHVTSNISCAMKEKILIATGNEGKAKELVEAFSDLVDSYDFLTLKDFPEVEEPEEIGKTFEANAEIKAQYYGRKFKIKTLSDDSGFILEAFPDRFGINTRRELDAKDDMEWMTQFLDIIEPLDNRSASFHCALSLYLPGEDEIETFLGVTEGEMMEFPQTPLEPGIPVSSVFLPEGYDEVFSAMKKAQKNHVSHRGKACQKLRSFLINSLE